MTTNDKAIAIDSNLEQLTHDLAKLNDYVWTQYGIRLAAISSLQQRIAITRTYAQGIAENRTDVR